MSLKNLIDLANQNIKLDPNDPEVKRRSEEAYKRVAKFDKECEERLRTRQLTSEQLNRIIDL